MYIYQRYIARNIALSTLMSIALVTVLVWVTQVLKFLHFFEQGISLVLFSQLILLTLPAILNSIIPFSILYAGLYVYMNMRTSRELMILEGAGVPRTGILHPLLLIGTILCACNFTISSFLLPWTHHQLRSDVQSISNDYIMGWIKPGVFNNISKNVVVYAGSKGVNQELNDITIFDYRHREHPMIITAQVGLMKIENGVFRFSLHNGESHHTNNNNTIDVVDFGSLDIIIDDHNANSGITKKKDIQSMSIFELFSTEKLISGDWSRYDIDRNNNASIEKTSKRMLAEGNHRIVWSLFNIGLPYIAVSILLSGKFNKHGYIKQAVVGFIAAIIVINLHFVLFSHAAQNNAYILLMYLNFVLCLGIGLYYTRNA